MAFIDLIRHGEPVGGRRYRGQLDDPLSELGWSQMRSAVANQRPWRQIISSPLLRCSEFAAELAQQLQIPLEIEPRLQEIGFGRWEGQTAEQIEASESGALQRFYDDPVRGAPPGAEGLEYFHQRVLAAWQLIIRRNAEMSVLVVAHAGVIRAIVGEVLGMPPANMFKLQVSNAGISRIHVGKGLQTVLEFHNARL